MKSNPSSPQTIDEILENVIDDIDQFVNLDTMEYGVEEKIIKDAKQAIKQKLLGMKELEEEEPVDMKIVLSPEYKGVYPGIRIEQKNKIRKEIKQAIEALFK